MERTIIENGYEDLTDEVFDEMLDGKKYGTIQLVTPVANINEWYDTTPNMYGLVLGMEQEEIEKIIYYVSVVVSDPGDSEYSECDIVDYDEIIHAVAQHKTIKYKTGLDALLFLVKRIDLSSAIDEARSKEQHCMATLDSMEEDPEETTDEKLAEIDQLRVELAETRALIDSVYYIRKHLDRLSITEINMIPLEIRSIIRKEERSRPYGVYHDLQRLYSRVASRNHRVKMLTNINAPEIIIRNEKRLLQESVDALIANGKHGRPVVKNFMSEDPDLRCSLTSLTDIVMRNMDLV